MSRIRIVADSCCDISPELAAGVDVVSVPFSVTIEDRHYIDDAALDVKRFIDDMKSSKTIPRSGCPSPHHYEQAVGDATRAFIITISSRLSASYESACVAKQTIERADPQAKIHILDSKSAVAGETLIFLRLKDCIKQGLEYEEIVEIMDGFVAEMETLIVLESLDNLIKNGRMTKMTGIVATMLNIIPVLRAEDGEIILYEKARGMKKALTKLVHMIGRFCIDFDRTLVISHCNNKQRAEYVEKEVLAAYAFQNIVINETRGLGSMYANDGGIVLAF